MGRHRRWIVGLVAMVLLAGLLFYCLTGSLWDDWLHPPLPETPPGAHAGFDQQLRSLDSSWRFLFQDGKMTIATDSAGRTDQVLLDLAAFTGSADASPSFAPRATVRLSPDRCHVLVPFLVGSWHKREARRLLLLDLKTGTPREVSVPNLPKAATPDAKAGGSYEYDCLFVRWVGPAQFVVSLMHWPETGPHAEDKKYLRFSTDRLEQPEETMVANEEEQDPPPGPVQVEVRVIFVGEFPPHPEREDVYLAGKKVHRTNCPFGPGWQPELGLYVWSEYEGKSVDRLTYCMDREGHYRRWHKGEYLGAVPIQKDR
jgi:hypothetical protein